MPREGHGSRNSNNPEDYNEKKHVMPREGHGSRNQMEELKLLELTNESCPARGMGVEIAQMAIFRQHTDVMPREGHGSRNLWMC